MLAAVYAFDKSIFSQSIRSSSRGHCSSSSGIRCRRRSSMSMTLRRCVILLLAVYMTIRRGAQPTCPVTGFIDCANPFYEGNWTLREVCTRLNLHAVDKHADNFAMQCKAMLDAMRAAFRHCGIAYLILNATLATRTLGFVVPSPHMFSNSRGASHDFQCIVACVRRVFIGTLPLVTCNFP